MSRLTSHLSYANVMATVAVFVAFGGVSYAAITLPINSVGSKQIKKRAVKNSDLGKNAVTTGKVKNGSLLSKDFKAGQLPAGATGLQGPKGLKGDTGDPGTNGTNGATNVTVVRKDFPVGAGATAAAYAECPAGQRATGGGIAGSNGGSPKDRIVQSGPTATSSDFSDTTTGTVPVRWFGRYFNGGGGPITAYVWAICSAP